MKTTFSKTTIYPVLLTGILGLAQISPAAMESTSPEKITMISSSSFMVNQHEVASIDLIKALKKNRISPDVPLVVEVPAHTPMEVIKELTQRLATAGFKPFFKYPRHADATVENQNGSAVIPQTKQTTGRK